MDVALALVPASSAGRALGSAKRSASVGGTAERASNRYSVSCSDSGESWPRGWGTRAVRGDGPTVRTHRGSTRGEAARA